MADVTAVVEIARTTGAKVVTQGTGHGASAYGSMSDTILIRTTQLQELAIGDGSARVGAGTLWGDVAGADSKERLISVEVRHLGGALARKPKGAGALSRIGAPYLLSAVGAAHDSEQAARSYDQLGLTIDAMRPWAAGEYLNFVERSTRSVFDDATTRRLAAVKSAVDPTNVFRLREGVQE